jgi:caffeoyl-CoA O-methyltransferase
MADIDSRKGHGYGTGAVLDWVNELHAPHDAALSHAFHAPEKHGMPAIQVGPSEGKTLELLLKLAGAKKVVEVGTLAGYSAIRMARVLPPGGHLWTIEFDPKHVHIARENIAVAKMSERVTVVEGAGAGVLPTLEKHGPFDAVFIDADKRSYDVYGRWAAKNLRRGGLLIGDNVYLFGRLLEDSDEAVAMRRFHEEAREHFDTVVIPTPDGLLLGLKR